MVDEPIRRGVQNYLRVLKSSGFPVSFGVIFGSRVSGSADEWSDIDVLVVSPTFDGDRKRQDIDRLWRLAARSDSRIEPIPCGTRQWAEDYSSALIEIARMEGEHVLPT